MFEKADIQRTGCLYEDEAVALMKKLNSHINAGRVHKKILEVGIDKTHNDRGRVDSNEFINMFKEIATRPEIYLLMIKYSSKDYFTVEDLQIFLEGEQGMMGMTSDRCREIIHEYELNDEARKSNHLLVDGFTQYLLSKDCDIFDPVHEKVCQDMSQPLSHYFISSSHNTYLLEDQLKGPSSVDGYIKALQKGCRCVKVEVWDGNGEPVVYHGNTLTSRIPFKDVVSAVNEYAFSVSQYPVIIHLETHCSVTIQTKIVQLLKNILGSKLYVPPRRDKSVSVCNEMSPKKLTGKILIKGKTSTYDDIHDKKNNDGFVTDEDEDNDDAYTCKSLHKECAKQYRLCKELSDVTCITRGTFVDLKSHKCKDCLYESFSIQESIAARISHVFPEEFVNHNKSFLTRVYPNSNRIDSSNFNPQNFWNCGCQMVAMNFQTPGPTMDLHHGKFKQNGLCGYVLKPCVMRDQISYFSARSKELTLQTSRRQNLKITVISAQQLPRPRGSTAKGEGIDPYVTLQTFGIPADCSEVRTRTVSNEGNCPVFEESFEFDVNLPELAVVRFAVLDDEFIGDDFIGQYTIPFDCIRPGYRHVQLLNSGDEVLEDSSLFLHISITNKCGGKVASKKSSVSRKMQTEIRPIGIKAIDECFKAIEPVFKESHKTRIEVDRAITELRTECGLPETANIKQCLRVIVTRLCSSHDVTDVKLVEENGFPSLKAQGTLNAYLCKVIFLFERVIIEYRYVLGISEKLLESLSKTNSGILSFYENFNYLCLEAGLKGKKYNKALENFTWNVTILRGQLDLTKIYKKDCNDSLTQVKNSAETIDNMMERDRSPIMRNKDIHCNFQLNNNNQDDNRADNRQPPGASGAENSRNTDLLVTAKKSSSTPSINVQLLSDSDNPSNGNQVGRTALDVTAATLKPHPTLTSTVSCPLESSSKSNDSWI
ncbi:Uncharacterised protein g10843 [Pycnogonum litorale]